jgi:hypothetical protein
MINGHDSEAVGYYCMPTMDHPGYFCGLTFGMIGCLREMEKFMIKYTENENTSKMLWLMVEENYSFVLLDLSYFVQISFRVFMQ